MSFFYPVPKDNFFSVVFMEVGGSPNVCPDTLKSSMSNGQVETAQKRWAD